MSEQKFKKGDLVKIITTDEKVIVIEYDINYTGNVMNAFQVSGKPNFSENVITDDVICEGRIDGKFQRKQIKEASLELIKAAQ